MEVQQVILTWASIITALGVIFGAVFSAYKWYLKQNKQDDAIKQIELNSLENEDAFILDGQNWHTGVIGIVSSKITEKYYKPSILIQYTS